MTPVYLLDCDPFPGRGPARTTRFTPHRRKAPHMTDLTGTDVAALLDGAATNDSGVAVLRDSATGGVAILLTADAAAALDTFLADLPLAHDLIQGGGYDPVGVDVILMIRHTLQH